MPSPSLLIELRVGGQPFFAPHEHVAQLALLELNTPAYDQRGSPLLVRSLAGLVAPMTGGAARQALIVRLRRRTVALLAERVERLAESVTVQPLPALLARHLERPWVLGAVTADEAPVLVLDLRRIATDVALGAV
jgi:chemotaxis signal transduction protein